LIENDGWTGVFTLRRVTTAAAVNEIAYNLDMGVYADELMSPGIVLE
jgi:hypothetical protein